MRLLFYARVWIGSGVPCHRARHTPVQRYRQGCEVPLRLFCERKRVSWICSPFLGESEGGQFSRRFWKKEADQEAVGDRISTTRSCDREKSEPHYIAVEGLPKCISPTASQADPFFPVFPPVFPPDLNKAVF